MSFTYLDLFSGIGGFRVALDQLGGQCLGFSEIDLRAIKTYLRNFGDGEHQNLGDIKNFTANTEINQLGDIDLLVGGVPCQSWSVAGKMRGFNDPRGQLWFDTIAAVATSRPKAFIFENVKGLADPRNSENLETILAEFKKIGYRCKWQLLNSFDFGVPQNRTRIFIVGFRKDYQHEFANFQFPKPTGLNKRIGDYLDDFATQVTAKSRFEPHQIYGKKIPRSRNPFQQADQLNDFFTFCDTRNGHSTIHSWEIYPTTARQKEICLAILKNRRKKLFGPADGNPLSLDVIQELVGGNVTLTELNKLVELKILKKVADKFDFVNSKNSAGIDGVYRIFLPNSAIFSTLTATGTKDMVATKYLTCDDPSSYKEMFLNEIYLPGNYRKITENEARTFQGFPNWFQPDVGVAGFKQFGNAVSPPVIKALAESLLATGVMETSTPNEIAG